MKIGQKFRLTSQRRIILEELRAAQIHPTADEIYARVKKRLPRVSLGTIYRNLETLAAQGMIRKLDLAGRQRRFEISMEEHYHVRCVHCDKLEDVVLDGTVDLPAMLRDSNNYEICDVRLEFLGVCPECSGKNRQCEREK